MKRVNNKLTNPPIVTCTSNITSISNVLTYPFLAGLIDGDGFLVSYSSTGEYMVTMHSEDAALLEQLQNQFGGDIRKVPYKKAVRFHLNQKNSKCGKDTLLLLTKGLNGHIRNSVRVEQFKSLCNALGVAFLAPKPITQEDGYIAGLFCSDGSVYLKSRPSRETIRNRKEKIPIVEEGKKDIGLRLQKKEDKIARLLKGVAPRAEISITCKLVTNLEGIQSAFGFGSENFSRGNKRSPGGHFNYRIYKEKDIFTFIDFIDKYPSHSQKHKRLNLIKQIYLLKNKGAHLKGVNFTDNYKWEAIIREWFTS
jgi:hypothetical protein